MPPRKYKYQQQIQMYGDKRQILVLTQQMLN